MVTRRTYPWHDIGKLARQRKGQWMTHSSLQDAPARTVTRIRARGHPDLRWDTGRLEARMTNEYVDEYGTRRGDIWVRFVPHSGVT